MEARIMESRSLLMFCPVPHKKEEEERVEESAMITLLTSRISGLANIQPYRVNIMKRNPKDGVPIYRHLLLEYPDDSISGTEFGDSEYFFGSEFLVSPILEEGTKDKVVYFPEGN